MYRAGGRLAVVIDHVSLQVSDVAVSRAFYQPLLASLNLAPLSADGPAVGFSSGGRAPFWLGPAASAERRELHIAFSAPDRRSVDAFHQAALGIGAEILNAPRVFPEYHSSYYACFVRDPDGHNIEAVCHVLT
jgi:catechol 2,3-dioxygenase-like lactoylglutathione lyase family enzyme